MKEILPYITLGFGISAIICACISIYITRGTKKRLTESQKVLEELEKELDEKIY